MIKVTTAIKMTNRQYVVPELLYHEGHKVTSQNTSSELNQKKISDRPK